MTVLRWEEPWPSPLYSTTRWLKTFSSMKHITGASFPNLLEVNCTSLIATKTNPKCQWNTTQCNGLSTLHIPTVSPVFPSLLFFLWRALFLFDTEESLRIIYLKWLPHWQKRGKKNQVKSKRDYKNQSIVK